MGEDRERGANAAQIGKRLRDLRGTRELSLRQLAKRIGASPSLLSQIENARVMPSVDTLYLLANELGVPVAAFFGENAPPGSPSAASIVRREERQTITLDHGVQWENLLEREEAGLRFMEMRYPPGATSGEHLMRHPGRHLFLVLAGELVFRVGFGEHRLSAGDTISFGNFEPHQVRNDGTQEARAIACVIGDERG